jgi:hypothetical protein
MLYGQLGAGLPIRLPQSVEVDQRCDDAEDDFHQYARTSPINRSVPANCHDRLIG